MRVLHILDHSIPLQSGYAFRTRSILEQQRALGMETFHLTSTKHHLPFVDHEEVDGLLFYRTKPSRGLAARLPVIRQWAGVRDLRARLRGLLDEIRPDVLHAHSPCLNAMAALPLAKSRSIPLVYEMRSSWEDAAVTRGTCREGDLRYRISRALETKVLLRADAITTICEGLRTEIVSRGIAPEKVTVIANAVNAENFRFGGEPDAALQEELGLGGACVLGYIGSFSPYEGLEVLIEALPLIVAGMPRVRLLLVGGGVHEEPLREQARRLGIDDKVVFTGRVPHETVARYYSLCDVMVYPRRETRLTRLVTPLKPLESMAQGRLVAASDIGGHRELVRDGETGVLFEPGSPSALAKTVLALLNAPERWDALRRAGREFVESERTWRRSVARTEPLYRALLEAR